MNTCKNFNLALVLLSSSIGLLPPSLFGQGLTYHEQNSAARDFLWVCGVPPCKLIDEYRLGAPPLWFAEVSDFTSSGAEWGLAYAVTGTHFISGLATGSMAGSVRSSSGWNGFFSATGDVVYLKWELNGVGVHNKSVSLPWASPRFDVSESQLADGVAIVVPQTVQVVSLGGEAISDGLGLSSYGGRILDIRQCANSTGALLLEETNKGLYKLKKWLRCDAGGWGYRLERVLNSAPSAKGWIGGCFHEVAFNVYSTLSDGGLRWINHSEGWVEIFEYNPNSDIVTKGRIPKLQYNQELQAAQQEGRMPSLPYQWRGTPPSDSETLGMESPFGDKAATRRSMTSTPAAWLSLSEKIENEWNYTLQISQGGAFIAPGDRIELRCAAGGRVEGEAASASAGGWTLLQGSEGSLVFMATAYAYLTGPVSGFIATGQVEGDVHYTMRGDWVGFGGMLSGPSPIGIFGDGFESGDSSAWSPI